MYFLTITVALYAYLNSLTPSSLVLMYCYYVVVLIYCINIYLLSKLSVVFSVILVLSL